MCFDYSFHRREGLSVVSRQCHLSIWWPRSVLLQGQCAHMGWVEPAVRFLVACKSEGPAINFPLLGGVALHVACPRRVFRPLSFGTVLRGVRLLFHVREVVVGQTP